MYKETRTKLFCIFPYIKSSFILREEAYHSHAYKYMKLHIVYTVYSLTGVSKMKKFIQILKSDNNSLNDVMMIF